MDRSFCAAKLATPVIQRDARRDLGGAGKTA
jgi:hypothetical protein